MGARDIGAAINFSDGIGFVEKEELKWIKDKGMITSIRDFNNQDKLTYIHDTSKYISRIVYIGEKVDEAIEANRILGVVFLPIEIKDWSYIGG